MRKETIKGMRKETIKGIESSDIFIVIVTENYYKDADAMEEFIYAKSLKKPMVLVIKNGTEITESDFKGCDIRHKTYFSTTEDLKGLEKTFKKIVDEIKNISIKNRKIIPYIMKNILDE